MLQSQSQGNVKSCDIRMQGDCGVWNNMKISLLVVHPDGGWDGADEPEQFVVLRYSDGANKARIW